MRRRRRSKRTTAHRNVLAAQLGNKEGSARVNIQNGYGREFSAETLRAPQSGYPVETKRCRPNSTERFVKPFAAVIIIIITLINLAHEFVINIELLNVLSVHIFGFVYLYAVYKRV